MAFQSYRDPIEYVVSRYFEKKRNFSADSGEQVPGDEREDSAAPEEALPESPAKLLRDEQGRVYKCIYGDYARLQAGGEEGCTVWQEEIIRNDAGETAAVETTYPDGHTGRETLLRVSGQVTEIK